MEIARHLPQLFPIGMGLMCAFIAFCFYRELAAHRSLPTLREYFEEFPECETGRGVRCCECGSGSIWQHKTVWGPIFECRHCGEQLYRR